MKMRRLAWLQVSLYLSMSVGAAGTIWAADPANGAGDVSSIVRMPDEINRETSEVGEKDVAVLARARAANRDVYSSLQSFVCKEEISRYKGDLNGQSARALDMVSAKLSFEDGVEQYSNIYENNRQRRSLSSLPGAWSEGEFGTLLLQTQQLLSKQEVSFDTFADVKGAAAAIYHFDVAEEESPWDLNVGGQAYRIAFRTSVWISVDTGEMLKIDRTTQGIAAESDIAEIQWSITLEHFTFDGKTWLLPSTGSYAVLYKESQYREWNLITFSGYRHYGSEAAVKFN